MGGKREKNEIYIRGSKKTAIVDVVEKTRKRDAMMDDKRVKRRR